MASETEIKLRIADSKEFLRKLKRLGAKADSAGDARVHEWNVIFDTPDGGLAKHGQLLRIRTETRRATAKSKKARDWTRSVLTFKRPAENANPGRHKVREEFEMEVGDTATLTKIFEGLGMRGWFRYEKYRTTFQLPAKTLWAKGLLIEMDETPVGMFVELEGPADAIDKAAELLGFTQKDYVLKNYLTLYIEDCRHRGEQPSDMVFRKNT